MNEKERKEIGYKVYRASNIIEALEWFLRSSFGITSNRRHFIAEKMDLVRVKLENLAFDDLNIL